MRGLREQPRVAVARVLWALCLIAAGAAIGGIVRDDRRDEARATEVRLSSAQRSVRGQRAELQQTTAQRDRALAQLADARRAVRAQRRSNQRLRRDLRIARRARDRAKRRE
jgi:chromosome segregation ATPase